MCVARLKKFSLQNTKCSQSPVLVETENNFSDNGTKETADNICNILSDSGGSNQINEIQYESEIRIKRKYKKRGPLSTIQFRKQNKKQKDLGKTYVNRKGQKRDQRE